MSPTKTVNIAEEAERLADAAAKAVAQANQARDRAEEAGKRAEEQRQAAILAIRKRRLEEYDEAALAAEDREARAAFERAVLDDQGAIAAFVAWQVATTRRYLLAVEARQAQAILEPEAAPLAVGGPSEMSFADEVQRVINRTVANLVEDVRDGLEAEIDSDGR